MQVRQEDTRQGEAVSAQCGASHGSVWSMVPDPSLREHSVMD